MTNSNKRIKKLSTYEPLEKKMFFRKDQFGNNEILEWTLTEYLEKQRGFPYLCEFIGKVDENEPICAFVDFDTDVVKEIPSAEDEEEVRQFVTQAFKDRLKNDESEYKLVFACRDREGFVVKKNKNGHKISWRIFSNLVTTHAELTRAFSNYFPTENLPDYLKDVKGPLFDISVYQSMRKMCCVDKQKSPSDSRILYRVDDESLDKYLIQNVSSGFNTAVWKLEELHVKQEAAPVGQVDKDGWKALDKNIQIEVLDTYFDMETTWDTFRKDDTIKVVPNCLRCLVNPRKEHSEKKHSCIYVNETCVNLSCFSCKSKAIRAPKKQQIIKGVLSKYDMYDCEESDSEDEFTLVDLESTNDEDSYSPEKHELCCKTAAAIHKKDKSQLIHCLNKYFSKVTHQKSAFYCFRSNPAEKWIVRNYINTVSATSHLTMTIKSKGEKKVVSLFSMWARSRELLTFKHIVMDPRYIGDKPGLELNMFRGFKAKLLDSYDPEIIKPVQNHMFEVFYDCKNEQMEYGERWFASFLQKPYRKTEVSPAIHGDQGTGKSLLFEWFGKEIIRMDHYLYVNTIDDLCGQFTGLCTGKIFTIGDEVLWSNGHKNNSIMKSKISQEMQKLELKGVDPVMIGDFNNYLFLSNDDDCVKVEKSDRRYWVLHTSSKYIGNREYFRKLRGTLTEETANHYYTYLMSLDLSEFEVGDIPFTQAKEDMKVYAMSPLEMFVEDVKDGNMRSDVVYGEYYEKGATHETTMDHIFDQYIKFIEDKKAGSVRTIMAKIGFSMKIRKILIIKDRSKSRHKGTPVYLKL
ncbi:hypothetical protein DFS34DRAFT_649083 [Phlyctochytrium arcticum]|nr:hypothetical protein DFS34DRAFT_649083 [Phlyctochytrium arcticum]